MTEGLGSVTALEWTYDGYALAVGWERGWGIYTVGGRLVAWSGGVEGNAGEGQ